MAASETLMLLGSSRSSWPMELTRSLFAHMIISIHPKTLHLVSPQLGTQVQLPWPPTGVTTMN